MKPLKFQIVSFLVYWVARLLAASLRLRVVGEERVTALQRESGVILVTWHGRTLIPITQYRRRGYWAIISTSRDGEYQDRIFRRFGFKTVRGSTSARGAVQAALSMARHLKAGATLAFTPDGPRGPIHHVQPGAIFLAQKSGCPIIPVGLSAAPRRFARAWDRYLIPLPFARAAMIYGEPIFVPADAKGEEEQRRWADQVGEAILAVEAEAERLVGAGSERGEPKRKGQKQWRRA